MCLDPATLAVAAKGAQAASGLLTFAQGTANARAATRAGSERAKAATRQAIVDQEQQVEDERARTGAEIANIANSGVSGQYGSPFLAAIENAENSAINRVQGGQAAGQQIAGIRNQASAQAGQFQAQAIGGLSGAAQAGYEGFKGFNRSRENRLYLNGHTLPGVV